MNASQPPTDPSATPAPLESDPLESAGVDPEGAGNAPDAADVLDVSIVIISYETPDHLQCCLESLAADGLVGRAPIFVVDNSASDGCAQVAAERTGVTLIRNPRNLGYARAVNQGIAAATTPFVLVLNPDIEVRPGAVATLRRAMDAHPRAGIAAAKLLNSDGSLQDSCRRFYTLGTILLRRTFLGRLFPDHRLVREHLMTDWDHAEVRNVDWVLGACLMVRRSAIDEVGPMDERFFLYFEDVDWCARMHNHDWEVLYVPDAAMIHRHRRDSARGGALSPSVRMHLTSVVRFYEKWSLLLYLLKRNRAAIGVGVLLLSDLAALIVAFLLAFGTRKLLGPWFAKPLFAVADYWQFLLVYLTASLLAFRGFGLYRGGRPTDPLGLLVKVTPSLAIASLAVLVSTFLLYIRAYSRFVTVLNLPLAIVAVTALRVALSRLVAGMAERGIAARRVLLVGDRPLAEWMAGRLEQVPGSRYEVVGIIDRATGLAENGGRSEAEQVRRLCHLERVSELILADQRGESLPLAQELLALELEGVRVRLIGSFSQLLGPEVAVEGMAGVPVILPRGGRGGPGASVFKRAVDVIVAGLLLLPVGGAALWIRVIAGLGAGAVRDTGTVGFTAAGERVRIADYRCEGSARGAERLLLLAWSFWQVLCGRMSLVGIHRYATRVEQPEPGCLAVRPGLITTRPDAPGGPENCLVADRAYVLGWSLATDLRLMLEAIRHRRRGRHA